MRQIGPTFSPSIVAASFAVALLLPTGVAAFPAAPYFPLSDGSSWTYSVSDSLGGSATVVEQVQSGAVVINDRVAKGLVDVPGGDADYYTNDANGIRSHGLLLHDLPVDPLCGASTVDIEVRFSPPVPLAAADVATGQSLVSSGTVEYVARSPLPNCFLPSGTYTSTSAIVGVAGSVSVTVPAGTYSNAVEVQTSLSMDGALNLDAVYTNWLASGVGIVKMTAVADGVTETSELVSASVAAPDTTPDAMSIAARGGLGPGEVATSAAVTVSGTNAPAPISVSGGEYSIDGLPYTSEPGSVVGGQTVTVRQSAWNAPGVTITAVLDVGGQHAFFDATTAGSLGAAHLAFISRGWIGSGQTRVLNATEGFVFAPTRNSADRLHFSISRTTGSPFEFWELALAAANWGALAPGAYRNGSGAPPPVPGDPPLVVPGVSLSGAGHGCSNDWQVVSSFDVLEASFGPSGEVLAFAADFSHRCSATEAPFTGQLRYNSPTPTAFGVSADPIEIAPIADAALDATVVSAPVTVTGIVPGFAPISVAGGEYSLDGGPFTSARGAVSNGQSLRLRVTAAPTAGTLRQAIASVGGVQGVFSVTTGLTRKNDFSGERRSDLLWRNVATGVNSIWFMNGTTRTSYATAPAVTPGPDWEIVGVGDFNADGKSDLMWRNTNTGSANFGRNTIWLMNGASRASYGEIQKIADANWFVAGVADFDGDGKADILWRNETTGQNSIWFMNGVTRTSYSLAPSVAGSEWKIVGVGDFNADGRADLMWRNTATGSANFGRNTIWIMNGASRTSYGELQRISDANWFVAGVADFNADGKADILWRNETTGQNSIWFMNGASRTSYALAPSVAGSEWKIVGIGDYDGDGKADLMWRNTTQASPNFGRNTIWIMNGATRTSYGELQRIADANWKVVGP